MAYSYELDISTDELVIESEVDGLTLPEREEIDVTEINSRIQNLVGKSAINGIETNED